MVIIGDYDGGDGGYGGGDNDDYDDDDDGDHDNHPNYDDHDDDKRYDEISSSSLQGPATASTTLHLVEQSLLVARLTTFYVVMSLVMLIMVMVLMIVQHWVITIHVHSGLLHPLQLQCWNSFLQDQIVKAWLDSWRSGRVGR